MHIMRPTTIQTKFAIYMGPFIEEYKRHFINKLILKFEPWKNTCQVSVYLLKPKQREIK